jgi:4-hydroxybenzoate polyprenyltransferase
MSTGAGRTPDAPNPFPARPFPVSPSRIGRLSDWLALLRLPNHATAAADVLAGWLLVSRPTAVVSPGSPFWWALAASLACYAAGMILNDVFDVELDRRERPERPLPAGRIAVSTASAAGHGLLLMGIVAALVASALAGVVGTAAVGIILTSAVYAYDRIAKPTAMGPAVMGVCRSLNWLLGMTAAGGPVAAAEWLVPAGMGLYVAGITLYARDEAGMSRRATLATGTVLSLAGLVAAGAFPWLAGGGPAAGRAAVGWLQEGRLADWTLLWGVIAASVLLRFVVGIGDPSAGNVRRAVGNAIMTIITFDAVLVLAACGESWAILVILLLVPFLVGRRVASVT